MRKILLLLCFAGTIVAFKAPKQPIANKNLAKLFDNFYEDRLKLNPLEATTVGDTRYNDQLPNNNSAQSIKSNRDFYAFYLHKIKQFKRSDLNNEDKLSYDIFVYEMQIALERYKYHFDYMPFNQFYALPITLAQYGSGTNAQPFKTVKDYDNWLKRLDGFPAWADTAIVKFNVGIKTGVVLPKALVVKMIPQMQSFVVTDVTKSLFYGPVNNLPKTFSDADRQRLTDEYKKAIANIVIPTYRKLGDYLQNNYLPNTRNSTGLSAIPGGANMYKYLVKVATTTNKTPDEVYQIGLSEVARIRKVMDSIKNAVGFKGDLKAFFEYMKTDSKFMPYKSPQEILDVYEGVHKRMESNLQKEFKHVPKTPLEIRQTEAFRAASAAAQYYQGTADGSRPGIFYVPILDPTKYNVTIGMESLFLHEGVPGHHYQISLTQENTSLPKFRRFGGDIAYVEGWALYCESLGKELGLNTDPYQHMGALDAEMHRAIRLVVDVGMHAKGMTREQAIQYMMDNEPLSEQAATAEIERYMAIAGQALGYKIGALKIRELRTKYEKQLGNKFDIADFHYQVLKDGSMPLAVFESKMDAWAAKQ